MTGKDAQHENDVARYFAGRMNDSEAENFLRKVEADPSLREAMNEYELTRYLDGDMTDEESGKFESRLDADPLLGKAAGGYVALDEVFDRISGREVDIDYDRQREEILDILEDRLTFRMRKRFIIGSISAAASIAAAIIAAIMLFSPGPDIEPGPSGDDNRVAARVEAVLEYPPDLEDGRLEAKVDIVELGIEIMPPEESNSFMAFLVSKRPDLWSDKHRMMLIGG